MRRLSRRRLYILPAVLLALGPAGARHAPRGDQRCEQLISLTRPGLSIVSATVVPAGPSTVPGQDFDLPASCRVVGEARPTSDSRIGFALWLPAEWTGRYVQLGNGGFAGNIDEPSLAAEIRRGNAAAMTDTGHKAGQFDANWALGHPERIVDYGYRSIKATADAAKLLIPAYYGHAPRFRYYIGCSNGGRQALMAAQRYPDEWDGVIAGSPAVQWTKQLATFAAIQHRLRSSPQNWIPIEKLPAIERAAVAGCSPKAAKCRVDVQTLACQGADRPNCLTEAHSATIELIQSGRASFAFGFDPRFAALPDNWDRWILNPDRNAPSQLAFATQAYRYFILERPDWEVEQFDPGRDFQQALSRRISGQTLSAILDADDPDLSRFARHGGKLIMYVGGGDAVILPGPAIAYYERLIRSIGPTRARAFARLFRVPAMQHCQGGPEPNAFGQAWVAPAFRAVARLDIRLALEAWVERGLAPSSIIAAKYEGDRPGGRLVATQQLFPYPQSAGAITEAR